MARVVSDKNAHMDDEWHSWSMIVLSFAETKGRFGHFDGQALNTKDARGGRETVVHHHMKRALEMPIALRGTLDAFQWLFASACVRKVAAHAPAASGHLVA
jgi:hypothetical protein